MTCAPGQKALLDEQLARVEAQIVEIRHILGSDLPCDALIAIIGEIQTSLQQVAAVVPGLCGEECQFRLTPDEFCAEFARTFAFQISSCLAQPCRLLTTCRGVPDGRARLADPAAFVDRRRPWNSCP